MASRHLNSGALKVSDVADADSLKNEGMVSIEHRIIRETRYYQAVAPLLEKIGRLRTASTCGIELALVAAGQLDAALKAKQPLYDFAAGILLVTEAGGTVTNFDGSPLKIQLNTKKATNILASNGRIDAEILRICPSLPL